MPLPESPLTVYTLLLLAITLAIALPCLITLNSAAPKKPFRRKHIPDRPQAPSHRNARKPPWVREALIRLAAHRGHPTCRIVAADFNRLFAHKGCSVGRTFVAGILKANAHAIAMQRRDMKARRPKPLPNHLVWAMDITFVQESPVIGILDHGSRVALRLAPLARKTSISLLRALLDAIDAAGSAPKFLRTDNEACFVSRTFRLGLWMLGIHHQRTDVASPWQNGRVERFFGTLKQKLARVVIDHRHLAENLEIYRFWYNEVRTHQNLDHRTPREALTNTLPTGKPYWFDAWGGVLQGYLFRLS